MHNGRIVGDDERITDLVARIAVQLIEETCLSIPGDPLAGELDDLGDTPAARAVGLPLVPKVRDGVVDPGPVRAAQGIEDMPRLGPARSADRRLIRFGRDCAFHRRRADALTAIAFHQPHAAVMRDPGHRALDASDRCCREAAYARRLDAAERERAPGVLPPLGGLRPQQNKLCFT